MKKYNYIEIKFCLELDNNLRLFAHKILSKKSSVKSPLFQPQTYEEIALLHCNQRALL